MRGRELFVVVLAVLALAIVVIVFGFQLWSGFSHSAYSLLVDDGYKEGAINAISKARSSILVGIYSAKLYKDWDNPLVETLCAARLRGVDVRVVLDDEPEYNRETVVYLRNCGVDARLDSPEKRLHAKFVVIDGRTVIIGSTNWSYSSLNKNHEVSILMDDPALARKLTDYFWSLQK